MIGFLEGQILKREVDRILLLVNHIGYEILVPSIVMSSLAEVEVGAQVALFIYYQQTERQPKPILIGFNLEVEKEFFQYFITVEDIGPLKAVKAMDLPVSEIAGAIENGDTKALSGLKGIGKRTAQKIVASLQGKMGKFVQICTNTSQKETIVPDFTQQVIEVMVDQLGYRGNEASKLVSEALTRNDSISSAEELFDEIYRG